ncbi:hypothetical protein ACH495_18805 [Micromonospora sp. NPDC018662]|uniref:hypothetical protein n=1 Tax=Micromonospora sp. NPDC018662 TaxID=3364238 RepID=UPI00378CF9C8
MPTPEEIIRSRVDATTAEQKTEEATRAHNERQEKDALLTRLEEILPMLLALAERRKYLGAEVIVPLVKTATERRGLFGPKRVSEELHYERAAWQLSSRRYWFMDSELKQKRWFGVDGYFYAEPETPSTRWARLTPAELEIEIVREIVERTTIRVRLYELQEQNHEIQAELVTLLAKPLDSVVNELTRATNELVREVYARDSSEPTANAPHLEAASEEYRSYLIELGLSEFMNDFGKIGDICQPASVDSANTPMHAPWLALRLYTGRSRLGKRGH